jgi:hypothetical protein
MDLTVEGSSVTGTGTWTAFSPDTVAIAGYIDNDNSVKLEITFPHETVTYFRASVVGNRTLNGTWDDPPADLRPMLFRRLD